MLILTRRVGQSVVIGEEIYVTVLGNTGKEIRLGFDAPERTKINREEIHNRIVCEKQLNPSVDNELSIDEALIDMLMAKFNMQSNNRVTH